MICYRCGEEAGKHLSCPACGTDLHIFQKAISLSNLYYNEGLAQASVRNLSGAVVSLRQSLKLYKFNIDARNLLGLVYYEMGEVVDALSEWVISVNYKKEDNLAARYLEEIHTNRAQLDVINQTIKKYNQALLYCKQDSRDLAIIQLKKVLSLNPKLVKGHQLLALLYLQEGQLDKAKKSLRNAGKIDTDNTTTLRYLKEVNRKLKEKGSHKKPKNDDLISYQSGNDLIIMPKRFRESSLGASLAYIIIGLVVGVLVTAWLIVPGVKKSANSKAAQKLVEANDTIATDGQTISSLEDQIEELEGNLKSAKNDNEEVQVQISSYESLLEAYQTCLDGDALATGKALADIDTKYLSKKAKKTYKALKEHISDDYMEALYKEGYSYYGSGDYKSAIKDLLKIVKEDESYNDGLAAYYLAQSYRMNNQVEKAKKYYQYIIDNYPGTQKARTSENYIDAEE